MTSAPLIDRTGNTASNWRRVCLGIAPVVVFAFALPHHSLEAAGVVDPDSVTDLTPEQALVLLGREGPLEFYRLRSLQPTTAVILAEHRNVVKLNALADLDEATATALARSDGEIQLNGLTVLGEKAAEALATSKGYVTLEGLQSLESLPLARMLAGHQSLRLPRVTAFRDDVAEVIGQGQCRLEALGLKSLAHPAIVAALVRPGGNSVTLSALTTLSPEAARKLCEVPSDLCLPALQELDASVAEELRNHQGVLDLGNLRRVEPEALAAIMSNQGPLDLGSLADSGTPAPKPVLDALSRHWAPLCLNGLTSLTPDEARAIAEHRGPVELGGLSALPLPVAIELAKCQGMIWLQGLQVLEP